MERMLKIQPLRATEGPRLYPFYCDPKGEIRHQDFWRGNPRRCIGFALPENRFEIAVNFDQVQAELENVRNKKMLPVFMDQDGGIYTLRERTEIEFIEPR